MAVDEALIQAGNFPCHSGLVPKAYRDLKSPKDLVLGIGARKPLTEILKEDYEWQANWDSLTEEQKQAEREKHRAFFREQRAKLNGGTVA